MPWEKGNPGRRITDEQRAEIVRLKVEEHLTYAQICTRMGVSHYTVHRALFAAGKVTAKGSVEAKVLATKRDAAPTALLPGAMPEWMLEGDCSSSNAEAFFPERGAPCAAAREMCAGCPVREQCLDYALKTRQRDGVWGGTTPKERARILRAMAGQAVAS
jgi:WhiB family redox-sensing transcriptional regulator